MTIDATRTEREAGQMLIGGEDVEAASGERLDVLNPATGQPITQIPAGDAEDVDRAVHAAPRPLEEGPAGGMHGADGAGEGP